MVPDQLDWGGGGKAVAVGSGGACVCVVIELETFEPRRVAHKLGHEIVQARHAGGPERESPEAVPGGGHGRGSVLGGGGWAPDVGPATAGRLFDRPFLTHTEYHTMVFQSIYGERGSAAGREAGACVPCVDEFFPEQ